jgi:hypothetical protein
LCFAVSLCRHSGAETDSHHLNLPHRRIFFSSSFAGSRSRNPIQKNKPGPQKGYPSRAKIKRLKLRQLLWSSGSFRRSDFASYVQANFLRRPAEETMPEGMNAKIKLLIHKKSGL